MYGLKKTKYMVISKNRKRERGDSTLKCKIRDEIAQQNIKSGVVKKLKETST